MQAEIINGWLSRSQPRAWFDIDGTLKGKSGQIHPQVKNLVTQLNYQIETGACTDQSPLELHASGLIFTGPSILEGGHVFVERGADVSGDFKILTSPQAMTEMKAMVEMFLAAVISMTDNDSDWGLLPGVEIPVALSEKEVGSVSVWERGDSGYDKVFLWFEAQAKAMNLLQHTKLMEVGNGTLRIGQIGVSKASLLQVLHDIEAIDLSASLYCGDGLNDLEAMQLVKDCGGVVVVPANACPEAKLLADIIADGEAGEGIVSVLGGFV